MNTYIFKDAQQQGPYTVEELDQLLQTGRITGEDLYWQEGLEAWMPVSRFPGFVPAPTAPPPPPDHFAVSNETLATQQPGLETSNTKTLGQSILAIPFAAAVLVWLGFAPLLIQLLAIVATSILVFIDAKALGIGSDSDLTSKGKKRNGPGQWLVFTMLLWIIGYPSYLFVRARRGAQNLTMPGIVAVIVFLAAPLFPVGVGASQPDSAGPVARIASLLGNASAQLADNGSDCAIEYVRLLAAKRYEEAQKLVLPKGTMLGNSDGVDLLRDKSFHPVPYRPTAKTFKAEEDNSREFEISDAAKANGISKLESYNVSFIYKPNADEADDTSQWEEAVCWVSVTNYKGKWFVTDCTATP